MFGTSNSQFALAYNFLFRWEPDQPSPASRTTPQIRQTQGLTPPQVTGPDLTDRRVETELTVTEAHDILREGTPPSTNLGIALRIPYGEIVAIQKKYPKDINGCRKALLERARPLTPSKLINVMAHPAIDYLPGIHRLKSQLAGKDYYEFVPVNGAMAIIDGLSRKEIVELIRIFSCGVEFDKYITVDQYLYQFFTSGLLTPANLLLALNKIGNQQVINKLKEHYPDADPELNTLERPVWKPDLKLPDSCTKDSPLNAELLRAIPGTHDWQALAYILGMPCDDIDYIRSSNRIEGCNTQSLIACHQLLEQTPPVTIGQFISACRQLGLNNMLIFFPEHLIEASEDDDLKNRQSEFLRNVTPFLVDASEIWRAIGDYVGVPDHELQTIAYDCQNIRNKRMALIRVFESANEKNFSWEKLRKYYLFD